MHPAHRLAPCAALLLAAVMPLAHAAGANANAGPYAAAIERGPRAGAWTSAVDQRIIDKGSLEMDVCAGYSRTVGGTAVYARYNTTFTRDFFGVADARGTGYLDLGAKHEFGPGLLLKLHAGDGRVAGAGNGVWNWRDLAAGLSTRLEGGWLVALNLTRAIGGAGGTSIHDRYSTGNVRADGRPWAASAGRRSMVLSLTRRF